MSRNSTSKMLARMVVNNTVAGDARATEVSHAEQEQYLAEPQSIPNVDMEQALTHILGLNSAKKQTPMD